MGARDTRSGIRCQYKSAVFFHDAEQEEAARATVRRLAEEGRFRRPIVTEIVPAGDWWRAEEYHQKYFEKNGRGGCAV